MKPIAFNTEFKYKCPSCGTTFWLTTKQVKTIGYKIACCQTLNITPIRKIEVQLEFSQIEEIVRGAFDTLQGSYPLEQIKKFQNVVNCSSKEDLVKKFLQIQV